MEYFVIGDEDTVLGFSLVGVAGRVATNADEARDVFRGAIENRSFGIIVISEPVADLIREVVDEYVFTSDFPLILEVPDRHGRAADRPGLREIVNQAIGIRV